MNDLFSYKLTNKTLLKIISTTSWERHKKVCRYLRAVLDATETEYIFNGKVIPKIRKDSNHSGMYRKNNGYFVPLGSSLFPAAFCSSFFVESFEISYSFSILAASSFVLSASSLLLSNKTKIRLILYPTFQKHFYIMSAWSLGSKTL